MPRNVPPRRRYRTVLAAAAAVLLVLPIAQASAQTLRIGLLRETSSLDPHLRASPANAQSLRHVYETLVALDAQQRLIPGLALSWTMTEDPTRWLLRLRPEVVFHDGQPFGAEDVVVSLARALDLPGGVAGFASYLRQVTSVIAIDALTVEITTQAPHPALPNDLTAIAMVSRRAAGVPTEGFNAGNMAIGTGPFRHVEWIRGQELRFERNDRWWGAAPAWRAVRMLPRGNDGARLAALLAGAVDLIEHVPTAARASLAARQDVAIFETTTSRLVFLALDTAREVSPHVQGAAGEPLRSNPLRDARVRQAISAAINREALVSQIMEQAAEPAAQLLPGSQVGTSAALRPEPYNPVAARRLLAEAGLPDGFRLALLGPNDLFLNDEKVLVAVAAMLRRVGIEAVATAAPFSIYRAQQRQRETSAYLATWGTETGDASLALRAILGAPGTPTGWGQVNFLRYANPDFEAALAAALTETNPSRRWERLATATEIGIADRAAIPLYFQRAIWAARQSIAYEARADEYTLAVSARPVR